ncbi:MAG: hypothetical protein HC828_07790 [Blastochloris sp.]|nr:hypothetical protein [Blastochloris sp.]
MAFGATNPIIRLGWAGSDDPALIEHGERMAVDRRQVQMASASAGSAVSAALPTG